MKNPYAKFLALLLCAAGLAGCGGSEPDTPPPTVEVPPPPLAIEKCTGPQGSGWCWQLPQSPSRLYLDIQFVDATHGWAVGEGGLVMATADGGRTWSRQPTPLAEGESFVRFADSGNGWAVVAGSGRMIATADGGAHWSFAATVPLHPVRAFWASGGLLVASGEMEAAPYGRSAISTDGGQSWRLAATPAVTDVGGSGTLWSRAYPGLWVSRDQGRTMSLSLDCTWPCEVSQAALGDDSRLTVITSLNTDQGLQLTRHTSSDAGRTWTAAPLGQQGESGDTRFIPAGLFDDGRGWAWSWRTTTYPDGSSGAGLVAAWRSEDAGRTWSRLVLPPQVALDRATLPTQPLLDSRTVWLTVDGRAMLSTDAGATWRAVTVPGEANIPDVMRRGGAGVLIAGFGLGGAPLRWYTSTDDGATWTVLPGGQSEDVGVSYLGLWFANASNGLALGNDGILRDTQDGGLTWRKRPLLLAGVTYGQNLEFTRDGIGAMLLDRHLFRSRDQGATWQELPLPASLGEWISMVQFVDSLHGWLVGQQCHIDGDFIFCDATLFATTDGGVTWVSRGPIDSNALVRFADAQVGVMTDYSAGILRTADGGRTWSSVMPDGGASGAPAWKIYFRSATEGWVLPGGVLPYAWRTRDAGLTWSYAALPEGASSMSDIGFADAQVGWMVGMDGRILTTRDGGTTWTWQASGTEQALYTVFAVDASHAWTAGSQGTLLSTATGGR